MEKNPLANAGDARNLVLIPESGRFPEIRRGNPLQYFLPGEYHGQRSLAGYSHISDFVAYLSFCNWLISLSIISLSHS